MKLSEQDKQDRYSFIDKLASDFGREIDGAANVVSDFATFEMFKYAVSRFALEQAGVSIDSFPLPHEAKMKDFMRIDGMLQTFTSEERVQPDTLFASCNTVRDKIARLSNLTEGQLIMIADDMHVEFMVRRYAQSILDGDINDLHKILDQGLGKSETRQMIVSKRISQIEQLTTDEIRALLGEPEEPEECEVVIDE